MSPMAEGFEVRQGLYLSQVFNAAKVNCLENCRREMLLVLARRGDFSFMYGGEEVNKKSFEEGMWPPPLRFWLRDFKKFAATNSLSKCYLTNVSSHL